MRILKILFKVGFLKLSSYIEASLVNAISALIFIVIQFFVWSSILQNNGAIHYTFLQMFSYIVFSQFIAYIYPVTIGKQMGNMIQSGEISLALLKPVSLIRQLIYENLGTSVYRFLFISIPVFLISFLISGLELCHNNILLFLVSFVLSYVVYIYIDLIFGLLQFYTTSSWGITSLKYAIITLCTGRMIPLSLYPRWAVTILDKLPFRFLYDFPLNVIVGSGSSYGWNALWSMVIWIIVLAIAFHFLFKLAIRKLSIMGG